MYDKLLVIIKFILLLAFFTEINAKTYYNNNLFLKEFKDSYISVPENKYTKTIKKLEEIGLKASVVGVDWKDNNDKLAYKLLIRKDYSKHVKKNLKDKNLKDWGKRKNKDFATKNDKLKKHIFEYNLGFFIGFKELKSIDSNSNNAKLRSFYIPRLNLDMNLNMTKKFQLLSNIEISSNKYIEPKDPVLTPLTQNKKILYNLSLGLLYSISNNYSLFTELRLRSFHYIYGNSAGITIDRITPILTSLGAKIKWFKNKKHTISSNFTSSIIFPKKGTLLNTNLGFGFLGSFKYSIKLFRNFSFFGSIRAEYNNLKPKIIQLSTIQIYPLLGIEGVF